MTVTIAHMLLLRRRCLVDNAIADYYNVVAEDGMAVEAAVVVVVCYLVWDQ